MDRAVNGPTGPEIPFDTPSVVMQDAASFESTMKGYPMRSALRFALSGLAVLAVAGLTACSKKTPPAQEAPQVNLAESDLFRQPVPPPTEALNPTTVVAKVNGQTISAQELERQLNAIINTVRNRLPPEQLAQLGPRFREQAINQLVAKQLLAEEVKKAQITVSPEELAEARAKIEASLPQGLTLATVLQQRNITEEQFASEFSDEFRINKLMEKHTSAMTNVTAEEAKVMGPWVKLAEYLGGFIGQMTDEPIKAINITYDGITSKMTISVIY